MLDKSIQKTVHVIEKLLTSASDGNFKECHIIAQIMAAVLFGTVPAFCIRGIPSSAGEEEERQLTLMLRAYLAAHRYANARE
ncbi:transcriptional regulator, TetR family protein [Erwinia tracheiphila PSU-1]|nr:transcriptional regulator, TetR family protein [Erwinia tracheiphila PSU-1]